MSCPGLLLMVALLPAKEPVDWPALTQKPYANRPVPDLGLRPLLETPDGKKITTRQEWERAAKTLRDTWLGHLGRPPEKPGALDVQVEKTEKLEGYTRRLLSFTAEGDDRIRAYLLVPDDLAKGEKRPAVVVFHETTRDTLNQPVGLGAKADLALALHLTRRGYVTLSPECYILKDPKGWAAGQAAALAKRRPDWTGMGKMTFDASRCVDFLEMVPEVDRGRIGCIGFSLGAKEVLYAMAFEPRYRAGVFNEGGIGLRMSNWTDPWYLTAKMKEHIPASEHHQVLALAAPRPLLVLGGDSADGDASWPFLQAALPVYELYGARERIGLFNHHGKHSFPPEGRSIAYRWLDHWLGHTPTREEVGPGAADAPLPKQEPNAWVKRSPLPGGPVSPGMGYETSLGYDPASRLVIRWGGHNQGGGGEQNAETWTYDLATGKWALREPNTSPPGVCCAQQNVFDPVGGRFLRFPAFSGSHGWQWFREIYLGNSSLWSYDLPSNTWRDLRPLPAPVVRPLRCASWDAGHQVAVLFGGEGGDEDTHVYDPHTNTWTRLRPGTHPAPRSGGNMAYDPAHKVHVLFGTQFGDDPHTWTYDLRANEWRDKKPAVQPPTDRNDAVLAHDAAGKVVIALVRVADASDRQEVAAGHVETWAYDAGSNEWKRMKPAREPDGWGNRRRVLVSLPDQGLLLAEVYVNPTERVPGVEREQQVWTYRSAEARAASGPLPPTRVRVRSEASAAVLGWEASPSSDVDHYDVYRGAGDQPWRVDYQRVARVEKSPFRDEGLQPGVVQHYFLRAVTGGGAESADSVKVRTQPCVVEDVVVSVVSEKEVRLSWKVADDAAGYHVERAPVEVFSEDEVVRLKKDTPPLKEPSVGALKAVGAFVRRTKEPVKETAYTDADVDLTRRSEAGDAPLYRHHFRAEQLDAGARPYRYGVYAYRVRAVNALGVEGGPSPYFLTLPSAPQWLFAREDGGQCRLKWTANPERGLAGYRVYRMEGPKVNGPGQKVTRLTEGPVRETAFTDPQASKDTKRYWVVAVDVLGQEGLPSAPAWHYRQFRKFYEPFVGDWHQ